MPLRAMAKAAFLRVEMFEKGLGPPVWNAVWRWLFAGDLFCFHVGSHNCTQKFFWAPLGTPRGGGWADKTVVGRTKDDGAVTVQRKAPGTPCRRTRHPRQP